MWWDLRLKSWEGDEYIYKQKNKSMGINAETLESWLETCPAVHRWFSELLGKYTASMWDVEQFQKINKKFTL